MASSFFALLDDIAVLAKASAASIDDLVVLSKATASAADDLAVFGKAAAASMDDIVAGSSRAASKSAAVLIDDAAVTPQYLQGISPTRELPVVWRIARGSLLNKAAIIVAIMLLSIWAPWIFPWALILGGIYLSFEGAEKVVHFFEKKKQKDLETKAAEALHRTPADENSIVRSAVTTDLVLSAEIMLISMSNFETDIWWMRLTMLIIIGLLMTAIVYGAVALLIKLDDVGTFFAARGIKRDSKFMQNFGSGLVKLMPIIFSALTYIGTIAMLMVGGHLLLVNFAEVGLSSTYQLVHQITKPITNGAALWFAENGISALYGLAAGLVIVLALKLVGKLRGKAAAH